jgi:hypothetical protein
MRISFDLRYLIGDGHAPTIEGKSDRKTTPLTNHAFDRNIPPMQANKTADN